MKITLNLSKLQRTKPHEYAIRFLFGGAITVLAGFLAKKYGPVFGGLFLAFPAIFPAGATLLEKHEREKRHRAGIPHTIRGQQVAALEARGTALGSVGLACFGLVVWKTLQMWNAILCLVAALAIWIAVSISIWVLRRHLRHRFIRSKVA